LSYPLHFITFIWFEFNFYDIFSGKDQQIDNCVDWSGLERRAPSRLERTLFQLAETVLGAPSQPQTIPPPIIGADPANPRFYRISAREPALNLLLKSYGMTLVGLAPMQAYGISCPG
jgi:hypothetical protein